MLRSVVCKQLLDAARQSGCRGAGTPNGEALPDPTAWGGIYAELPLKSALTICSHCYNYFSLNLQDPTAWGYYMRRLCWNALLQFVPTNSISLLIFY